MRSIKKPLFVALLKKILDFGGQLADKFSYGAPYDQSLTEIYLNQLFLLPNPTQAKPSRGDQNPQQLKC